MIDKIFKTFFNQTKQMKKTKCLTLVRADSFFNQNQIISKRESSKNLTCLSEYFNDLRGLNLKERELASGCTR